MFKIDSPYATSNNEFKGVDPLSGEPGTRVSADWLNAVQRELIAVITAAGASPLKSNDHQVRDAILSLIETNAPSGGGGGGGATVNGLNPVAMTANTAALNRKMYLADTTAGQLDLYLPGGTEEKVIGVLDAGPFFGTNQLNIYPGVGQQIRNGAVLAGLFLNKDNDWAILYQAANSTVWEYITNKVPDAAVVNPVQRYVATATIGGVVGTETVEVKLEKRGNIVTVLLHTKTGLTKNATAGRISVPVAPEYMPPFGYRTYLSSVVNNGATSFGFFQVNSYTTALEIFADGAFGNFPADAPNCGWYECSFSYMID